MTSGQSEESLDVGFVFGSRIALPGKAPVKPELSVFSYGANDADIDRQILLRDFQALPSNEATNQNSGRAVEPLSLVRCECPANDHFCRMARKAVSLRCPFGELRWFAAPELTLARPRTSGTFRGRIILQRAHRGS